MNFKKIAVRLPRYFPVIFPLIGVFYSSNALAGSWLLGFSPADTVAPRSYSVIAGTGGQWSTVGNPHQDSFTPFLAHSGIRTGLIDGWDIGYRLATIALPYSSVGPSLGGEIDMKHRLTGKENAWQAAILAGLGYAYLDIEGESRSAWSPGADMVVSHLVAPGYTAFAEFRYVYTDIPTAKGGNEANYYQALGPGVGVKIRVKDYVSLTPEVGMFDFLGNIAGREANGIGVQYGTVLGFLF